MSKCSLFIMLSTDKLIRNAMCDSPVSIVVGSQNQSSPIHKFGFHRKRTRSLTLHPVMISRCIPSLTSRKRWVGGRHKLRYYSKLNLSNRFIINYCVFRYLDDERGFLRCGVPVLGQNVHGNYTERQVKVHIAE